MYGEENIALLVQVVVLQLVVWCPVFLCLYELHAVKVTMNGNVGTTNDTHEGKEDDEMMDVQVMKNPNTYGSVLGLICGLISFRWNIRMPKIIDKSVSILSDTGLGMATFSLGIFMGSQRKIIACGKRKAILSMVVRFIFLSSVMAMCSIAIGIRSIALKTAAIQTCKL
ncbi:auxin efflux carrier component 8-like [Amborella trichopoda]|uniref:auxin efflux carrier component 8-like n=1 Tax=Amborella trichopoda TaxID=13333 RepID=UPI0009C199B4|nr:auxin efflux carrier component 8-like [Amborella trichopoda]|eukprot:XP_020528266.1 auxin efflux carrier component 8-like [Amborella trichopoda]